MTEGSYDAPLTLPHITLRTKIWHDGETVSVEASGTHILMALYPGMSHRLAIGSSGGEVLYRALDNTVTFLPDGHAIQVRPIGGTARVFALAIKAGWIEDICGSNKLALRSALVERSPRIVDAARWLQGASSEEARPSHDLVHRLMARLLATTFGSLARRSDDSWLPATALGRIAELIAGGQLEQLTIGSLAANAGLGVSAFSRAFRGSTGWTPGDHLIAARLDRVTSLLDLTNLPLAEIARRVGLSSVAHVSQQICARHGMSARRYRASRAAKHMLELTQDGTERRAPPLPG